MIPVPLARFLVEGTFGPIHLGMSHAALEPYIGPIRDWDTAVGEFRILRFGDVELHLERERLFLIFMHPSDVPSGGDLFDLGDWFLRGDMDLARVKGALDERTIGYHELIPIPGRPYVHLRMGIGVEACFDSADGAVSAVQWMQRLPR